MGNGVGGAAAIIGIGQTEFSKAAGRSETQLASEAILAALADAGLTTADVNGLVSYTIDPVEEVELVRALGIPEINFSSRIPYGGGGSQGVLLHAAAAIASGAADVVVAYRAVKARSGERFGRAGVGGRATSQHSGSTAMQWSTPYGVLTPASWMSLNIVRYMHTYKQPARISGAPLCNLESTPRTTQTLTFTRSQSCWRTIKHLDGLQSRPSDSLIAARRPMVQWRLSSRPQSERVIVISP
jgi:acetyl-CoA acetyltransferase